MCVCVTSVCCLVCLLSPRIVGIYLQILTRILYKDVSRFTIIFILFLLTYTGALLLALRGERWEPEPEEGEASPTAGAGDTAQASEPGKTGTELDITRLTRFETFMA